MRRSELWCTIHLVIVEYLQKLSNYIMCKFHTLLVICQLFQICLNYYTCTTVNVVNNKVLRCTDKLYK